MRIYLDANATTPLDPRVHRRMCPWERESFGNASSRDHRWGWDAADEVEQARSLVADTAGVPATDVLFVSGATEALNTIIRSYVGFADWPTKRIVTCATEHDAVLRTSRHLCARTGVALDVLPVDAQGRLDLDRLRRALARGGRSLVALMAANNETGVVHPVREIAALVHAAGGSLLCDTTQAFGKTPVDVAHDGIDFATLSAHKIHGPKGAGALLVRDGLRRELEPLMLGGGQEHGLRGGTLDVPGIVGLGEASRLVREELVDDVSRMRCLRDHLEAGILSQLSDTWVNGDGTDRLCNTSNIGFRGIDARALIRDLDDIAVSTRSACSSGDARPSHVLTAMGLSDDDAYACVRFSLGRFTTPDEVDHTIGKVVASVHKLRRATSARR